MINHKVIISVAKASVGMTLLGMVGCTTSHITVPARAGIEQLLLSTAADNALKGVEIPQVAGEKVFLVETYVDSYDKHYVIGSIRALLSENGALLQNNLNDANVIIEARVGGLGMDASESLVGMPSLPIPIPSVGSIETPELALFGHQKEGFHRQNSASRILQRWFESLFYRTFIRNSLFPPV